MISAILLAAVAIEATTIALQPRLMPDDLPPQPFPWPVAVTAGLAAATPAS